jgi:hypothetical protein
VATADPKKSLWNPPPPQQGTDSEGRNIMSSDDIPAAPSPTNYRADEITLYGVKLNSSQAYAKMPLAETGLGLRLSVTKLIDDNDISNQQISVAVVYGYAFEGQCYRLDKPRLLVFAPSVIDKAAEGCGYGDSYRMWRITSKTILLDLATSVGLAEDLLLEDNLPGNRPPNTYGNKMQLAHRGGRLSRTNGA